MSRRRKPQERLPLAGSLWAKSLGRDFPGLTMADRAVGLLLTHYADYESGRGARPSQETVAEALGISERTVRASLKRLEEAGAITCTGRYHRVKVYDLVLCNRNGASAYEEGKAAAMSDVTGRDASRNRNGASDNQSEHPDPKGGMEDDERQESARLRLAPSAIPERRMKVLLLTLPESWQGAALSRSHPALAEAVAELDAAGWTRTQIQQGLSTLGALKNVKNPSAVLAAHLRQMIAAGPSDVVTVPKAHRPLWHEPALVKPYSDYLGVPVKIIADLCDAFTAAGFAVHFQHDEMQGREDRWLSVDDPRIPELPDVWLMADISQDSASVTYADLQWRAGRKDHDDLGWCAVLQEDFPRHLRQISDEALRWWVEHRPAELREHLEKQGLAQAVGA